jgi:hypothetical protein
MDTPGRCPRSIITAEITLRGFQRVFEPRAVGFIVHVIRLLTFEDIAGGAIEVDRPIHSLLLIRNTVLAERRDM